MTPSDESNPNRPSDAHPDPGSVGDLDNLTGEQPEEVARPRRAASAEFEVESTIGAQAAMRDAMDPANQSLGEALRLSFRVLQLVILALVIMFLASGFKTVETNQAGVLTVWGRIAEPDGEAELLPGPHFTWWPYPAGQFELVQVEDRHVRMIDRFWPSLDASQTEEQAIAQASVTRGLLPGRDGFVLTKGGEIAHIRIQAGFQIDNLVQFLNNIQPQNCDTFVNLALERATIKVAGLHTLEEFTVSQKEVVADRIMQNAQDTLNSMHSGIRLTSVNVIDTKPAFAIVNAVGEVQAAREASTSRINSARDRAREQLINTCGKDYQLVLDAITAYERAVNEGDDPTAEERLTALNELLLSDTVGGAVSQTIRFAQSYKSQIDASLGNDVKRFNNLRDRFRDNPQLARLVIRQRWMETLASVFARDDVELYYVPQGMGVFNLRIRGLDEVQEIRQRMRLDARQRAAMSAGGFGIGGYIMGFEDREGGRRQLKVEDGQVKPKR
jgi:regulator of protease activity HflC (stomatin/prohibitin superfamily)